MKLCVALVAVLALSSAAVPSECPPERAVDYPPSPCSRPTLDSRLPPTLLYRPGVRGRRAHQHPGPLYASRGGAGACGAPVAALCPLGRPRSQPCSLLPWVGLDPNLAPSQNALHPNLGCPNPPSRPAGRQPHRRPRLPRRPAHHLCAHQRRVRERPPGRQPHRGGDPLPRKLHAAHRGEGVLVPGLSAACCRYWAEELRQAGAAANPALPASAPTPLLLPPCSLSPLCSPPPGSS